MERRGGGGGGGGKHLGELVPHPLHRLNQRVGCLVGNLVQAHALPALPAGIRPAWRTFTTVEPG